MPLTINGKAFLNIQEAVAWLLANNALPFQCKVNYVADTEIAKTNIINPSPAEIKIGSLVLFADGKVGTVSGITASGFMVGAESTDLSDGVPHITDIELDSSDHLIFTMSEGSPIDAGLVKTVSSLTIDASQHLIANYNDGTSTDLGAIFQGNVNIAGNLTADSIIENMSGYSFNKSSVDAMVTLDYAGVVKTGNKVTFVQAGIIAPTSNVPANTDIVLGTFTIPNQVASKLFNITGTGNIDVRKLLLYKIGALNDSLDAFAWLSSYSYNDKQMILRNTGALTAGDSYAFRYECTFLLSANMAE